MTYYFKYTCEACNGEGRTENPNHPLNDYKDPVCNECDGAGYPYDIRWSYSKELA